LSDKALPIRRAPKGELRERVLAAAFATFTERGYAGASTLEIARRANASKRELYTMFNNKQGMLVACIAERTQRMRAPLQVPEVRDRDTLAVTLRDFGTAILTGVTHPKVLAVYRLAVAEAERVPDVADALYRLGRKASQAALAETLAAAQARGLLGRAEPAVMASQFFALLFEDLLVQLLLRVANPPGPKEIERRAEHATRMLLRLHDAP
jgi:AcrR family transcriptional regulator